MRRAALTVAGAVALGAVIGPGVANAFDLGYGPRYNNHLSQYDGRPLGPPLTAFGPSQALDDGDPRALYTPRYQYYNGQLIVTAPGGYVPYRKPRRVYR